MFLDDKAHSLVDLIGKIMTIHAMQAQNRHILAMIGIGLWSNKQSSVKRLAAPIDRLSINPRLEHLLPDAKKTPQVEQVETDTSNFNPNLSSQASLSDIKERLVQISQSLSVGAGTFAPKTEQKVSKPQQDVPTVSSSKDRRYHLQGVRYDGWVLVVDMMTMNTDEQSVWLSLCQALSSQAQKTQVYHHIHQVHYPLVGDDEYLEHQNLMPLENVFLGFMLRFLLQSGAYHEMNVAFLTTLPDDLQHVQLNVQHQKLPKIAEMTKQSALKKQLWSSVVHTNQSAQSDENLLQ